jgi:hypothetical protein
MPDFEFSSHAMDMMNQRNIPEEWFWQPINTPAEKELGTDGNLH